MSNPANIRPATPPPSRRRSAHGAPGRYFLPTTPRPSLRPVPAPGRALPGADPRIVEARHDGRPAFAGEPPGDLLAAFRSPIIKDDLGAPAPRSIALPRRSIGRHDDHRANPEPPRRDRDA